VQRPIEARDRLAWATAQMPVLASLREELGPGGPLRGQRVALCAHLTAETAVQVLTLRALGADVACCASNPATADDGMVAELRARQVVVFGRRGMDAAEWRSLAGAALRAWPEGPSLVADEGAFLLAALAADHAELAGSTRGATEKTPAGARRARDLAASGRLGFPVLDVDSGFAKHELDNSAGAPESIVESIGRVSGRLIAGKTFVVAGYGPVGAGIAQRARGLGAEVIVTEVRPTRALLAVLNGFDVMPMAVAVSRADFVCTVTGAAGALAAGHLDRVRDGAVLANGGHDPWEIDLDGLNARVARRVEVGPGNERLELNDGRAVHLLAGGETVNLAAGRGNPSEVMDGAFAIQVLGLVHLAGEGSSLPPGVHPVPARYDDLVAGRLAAAMGLSWAVP
jgi:adenosylhomocysteinase